MQFKLYTKYTEKVQETMFGHHIVLQFHSLYQNLNIHSPWTEMENVLAFVTPMER